MMIFDIEVLTFICQLVLLIIISYGLYIGRKLEDFNVSIVLFLFTLLLRTLPNSLKY
jgi:hypothetical protein